MLKHLLIALVGVGIVIGIGTLLNELNTMEVVNSEVERIEVEKEVTPDWANDQEAVAAAKAVIRRKELEVELSNLESSFASTTASYEAESVKYKEKKKELEKELNIY